MPLPGEGLRRGGPVRVPTVQGEKLGVTALSHRNVHGVGRRLSRGDPLFEPLSFPCIEAASPQGLEE